MPTPISHFADTSHWTDAGLDLHAYAKDCPLIILKCSEGDYTDPTYTDMANRVRSVPGLVLGAYAFLNTSNTPGQEDYFLQVSHLRKGDLSPVVDAETAGLTREETFAALRELQSRGYTPILYCSHYFYTSVLGSPTQWALWIAAYQVDLPQLPADVNLFAWQHSQNATVAGFAQPCDISYLYQPLEKLLIGAPDANP